MSLVYLFVPLNEKRVAVLSTVQRLEQDDTASQHVEPPDLQTGSLKH